jgi:hypothetical protein
VTLLPGTRPSATPRVARAGRLRAALAVVVVATLAMAGCTDGDPVASVHEPDATPSPSAPPFEGWSDPAGWASRTATR